MAVTLSIEALGHKGEGIAVGGDGRVFVPYSLPGERVSVEIAGERGRLVEVLEASAERIEAFCPHFGACGGCSLQHAGPSAYRAFKHGLVETPLRRAGIDVVIGALIDAHGRGRRRATLHARKEGAGFMAQRSHQVHNLDFCPILVPDLRAAADIARAAQALVGECEVSVTASLLGIDCAIRLDRKTRGEALIPLLGRFKLARLSVNGTVLVQVGQPQVRMGKALVGLPTNSFLQATEAAEDILAGVVLEAVGKAKTLADLFCGVGPFALRLAEKARVMAADSDKPAIEALRAAARVPGIKPIEAKVRDLFRDPLTRFELDPFDAVVFDPPRAGAEMQVRQLAASKVPLVVGVSCDPGTFARDASILIAGGYRLESVVPVDQFAWSAHVELVGVFRR